MPTTVRTPDPQRTQSPEKGVAPQPSGRAARPPGRRRDPWFDNAKMLLVTLVVVGHVWALLPSGGVAGWLYDFLYLWHMPAFVMVTGHLSRSFTWSTRNLNRLATAVLVPYLVFEAALAAFRTTVGGEDLDLLWVDPHWPMWFLVALLLWRLATPVLTRVRGALPLAVTVSLLGGLTTGDVLDLARVAGFLPFFVLGLLARPGHLALLRSAPVRKAAAGLLGVGLLLASLIDGRMRTEWLYWRSSYAELGVTFGEGVAIRLGLLVAGGVLALAFLALVPGRGGWLARLGGATMVVYLMHGFFLKAAEYAGLPAWAEGNRALALLVTTGAAVVLALTLAAPPVARRLGALVDPVGAVRRRQ